MLNPSPTGNHCQKRRGHACTGQQARGQRNWPARAWRSRPMIFVLREDGTVEVVDGIAEALEYEPFDVENQVFVFYDEDGTWLKPVFTSPNRRGFFGMVPTQGSFDLVRSAELD